MTRPVALETCSHQAGVGGTSLIPSKRMMSVCARGEGLEGEYRLLFTAQKKQGYEIKLIKL